MLRGARTKDRAPENVAVDRQVRREVLWKVHKENPEQVYGIEIVV